MQTNTTFQKTNKKPKQGNAPVKAKSNKPKHTDKRGIWSDIK